MAHTLHPQAEDATAAAAAYEAMVHAPNDPEVIASYVAFKAETMAQWADIVASGLTVEFHDGGHHYPNSPALFEDMANGHLWTYLTDPIDSQIPEGHPVLEMVTPDLMLNDIFRAVHDVNGHGVSGGSFALSGEFKAWTAHRSLYSQAALVALWCETRGQSAWTNRHADHAALPLKDRPFATQKAGKVPAELV